MAMEEALYGMYDPRLKPGLLYSIIACSLPDDRAPSRPPSQLSVVVCSIRRHGLLKEESPCTLTPTPTPTTPGGGSKAADMHKASVDAWVDRITSLTSSPSAEKNWVGACLLGISCQECTRQRFLESYSSWFQKLFPHLKLTNPLFVCGATCSALTDLLTRLGGLVDVVGVKREGTAISGKLVQPVLQLLNEENSCSIWNEGVDLLCAMLKYFPSSIKQHSSQVESLLVSKMMEADSQSTLSQKYSRCLALLPKAHGDAAAWASLFRRILLVINSQLHHAFAGMEDASIAQEAVASLVISGQESSLLLAGYSTPDGGKGFWQLLVPRLSLLLRTCYYLLISPYPVQVPVPLRGLLALVSRILSVDGSAYRASSAHGVSTPIMQQTSLCAELPSLHLCALDLLYATICGVRSQLLPRAAEIARLLIEYFRHCGSIILRIKLYGLFKHLLISMGVGMASALAPPLIENALSDLKGFSGLGSPYKSQNYTAYNQNRASSWGQSINARKRKDADNLQGEYPSAVGTSDGGIELASPIDLQISALQAIEALLTVGGSLCSDRWRMEVDVTVAKIAMQVSMTPLSPSHIVEDDLFCTGKLKVSSGAYQLAAYKTLLASVLSPCAHRPAFLSHALSIFRKGRQEVGSDIANFCAHALLALEPLIHPRSLPPVVANTEQAASYRASMQQQFGGLSEVPLSSSATPLVFGTAPPNMNMNTNTKVSHAGGGMQIEVEGDPYVQEDIESWIIDYGGDATILNECTTNAEGMDEEEETFDQNTLFKAGSVCARQSATTDNERLLDGATTASADLNPITPIEVDAENTNSCKISEDHFEMQPMTVDIAEGGEAKSTVAAETSGNSNTLLAFPSASPAFPSLSPLPSSQTKCSDSDSDAIPDIVDGDPDSD